MEAIPYGTPVCDHSVVLVGGPRGLAYQRSGETFRGADGSEVTYDELFALAGTRDPLLVHRPVPYATLARTFCENFVLYTVHPTRKAIAVFDTKTSVLTYGGRSIEVGGERKADSRYLIERGYDILAPETSAQISSIPRLRGSIENPRPLIEALLA